MIKKSVAIVDSSFYIHLVKINLIDTFLDLYDLVVCTKVKDEITYFEYKSLYTPFDIEVFNKLLNEKKIIIKDPKNITKQLESEVSSNSGELYSIALAQELNYIVFIDNGRPFEYCKNQNIMCANIIEFLLYLYSVKLLPKKEIIKKLKIISKSIPKKYLLECLNILNVKKL